VAALIHLLRLTGYLCRALDRTTGACVDARSGVPRSTDVAAFGLALVELLTRAKRMELAVATVPAVSRRQRPFPEPRAR
jgi:hypothetical protein